MTQKRSGKVVRPCYKDLFLEAQEKEKQYLKSITLLQQSNIELRKQVEGLGKEAQTWKDRYHSVGLEMNEFILQVQYEKSERASTLKALENLKAMMTQEDRRRLPRRMISEVEDHELLIQSIDSRKRLPIRI
jgi:hypothetical protein